MLKIYDSDECFYTIKICGYGFMWKLKHIFNILFFKVKYNVMLE